MAPRQEFQEDSTVNRQIATNANTPQRRKDADGSEVWRAGCDETEDRGDADGEVERPAAPEDVAAEAPEDGAEEEADILGEGEEGWMRRVEFVGHGCEDERCADRPSGRVSLQRRRGCDGMAKYRLSIAHPNPITLKSCHCLLVSTR